MTSYFLTAVSIEGFRGINNSGDPLVLRFRPDAVNSTFATNGLCKSSVFDAISYAIRGKVPKLEALHAAEHAEDYYCNLFHEHGTSTIELTFTPDDDSADVAICVTRAANGMRTVTSPTGHADPEALLNSLDGEFVLLDQAEFQRFVDDSPLQRGRTFSGLLGFAKLSRLRQVLEVLAHRRSVNTDFGIDALQAQVRHRRDQAKAALTQIRSLYKEVIGLDLPEPIDDHAVLTAGSTALASVELVKEFFAEFSLDKVDFDKVREAIRKAEQGEKRERLSVIIRAIDDLKKLSPSDSESREFGEMQAAIGERDEALAMTRGPLLAKLYRTVSDVMESEEWDDPQQCPACESRLTDPLAPQVRERLRHYETVDAADRRIQELWKIAGGVQRFRRLEQHRELAVPADECIFGVIDAAFRTGQRTLALLERARNRVSELETLRKARIEELTAEREVIEKELPPSLVELTRQAERAASLAKSVDEHRSHVRLAEAADVKLKGRLRWTRFVKKASEVFAEAEVALSTAKTTAIESEYRSMYREITNNPEVVPMLKRATGTEDLHLRLDTFYGLNNVSATTLLQESYRNALAMSIYLSTALMSQTGARFLVLDDVTSSFDAGHQFALMELIRTKVARPGNPNGPQIIMLSHDGLLQKYFDKLAGTTDWHHQRLQGLPPRGAVMSQSQNANRLRNSAEQFLNAGQMPQAEPLIRQYLEYKLLQVINKVRVPVPLDFAIRDDRKMVDNAVTAISEAINLHSQAGDLILDAAQLTQLTTVLVPALVGNWVTHYATGGTSGMAPHVLLGVLQTVDDFSDCFKYDCNCGGGTQRRFYKSLSQKHCSC